MSPSPRVAHTVASPECRAPVPLGYAAPFERALAELAALGYDGVEIQVQDPERVDPAALEAASRRHGLAVAAVGTGPVGHDGAALASPDPAARARARARLTSAARLAGRLGVPVTLGRSRGRTDGGRLAERQRAWAVRGIEEVADAAGAAGVRLLLEPQEPGTTDLFTDFAEARELLDRLGHEALGLVLDTHHMAAVGDDPAESVRAARGLLGEVQLAGPDRGPLAPGEPGLARLLHELERTGFAGWLVMEHRQLPDSPTAARRSLACLRAPQ
ncbi:MULTISPECIES: sugar phosphate isomerase/epimerase [unclassified Nocardiopsis]|uniref:sugar phosphate isomerase/epimerase family protein n=1 Tax=unclassified Nocardiopsis TaxID=2649073 RepID=UPI001357289D|nr:MULTISPECIES: sugar phosphate isomerase/epimerase family protein [unclassified Nocardiopsis]